MKKVLFVALPIVVFVGATYWYFNFYGDEQITSLTALEKTGDECSFISEKSAMHLPETLPFQKLEKAARKARVLNQCMQDRAYTENPAWVKAATMLAKKDAEAQHISYDEAYESLRRQAMYNFKSSEGMPLYWIAAKSAS
jgi:hypothetical protein